MRAVIDRIEDDLAVLLLGSEEIQLDLPRAWLPENTGEGSILRITFELDEHATEATRERMRRRIDRLRRQNR